MWVLDEQSQLRTANHWREYEKVEATIVSGGGFFPLKGMIQDATPRRMTLWLHQALVPMSVWKT
jgi:hypothetical protein